jgi:hypothetical protein
MPQPVPAVADDSITFNISDLMTILGSKASGTNATCTGLSQSSSGGLPGMNDPRSDILERQTALAQQKATLRELTRQTQEIIRETSEGFTSPNSLVNQANAIQNSSYDNDIITTLLTPVILGAIAMALFAIRPLNK